MPKFGDLFQSGDWKNEKHVPSIDCPDQVKADEYFEVRLSIGREIAHPNTTEHHIRWIKLYFKPDDDKFTYELGNSEFTAHGECVAGADQGPAYSGPAALVKVKINKSGTLIAASYCNNHGLWENSKTVSVA